MLPRCQENPGKWRGPPQCEVRGLSRPPALAVWFTIAPAQHRAQMDRTSRLRRPFLYDRDIFVTVACLAALMAIPQAAFARGREGHQRAVTSDEWRVTSERFIHPITLRAVTSDE
jgi:hypothetical protein